VFMRVIFLYRSHFIQSSRKIIYIFYNLCILFFAKKLSSEIFFWKVQIITNYKKIIFKFFVLLFAGTRTGNILSLVREITPITRIKACDFRIKSEMCKRSVVMNKPSIFIDKYCFIHIFFGIHVVLYTTI